jgi:hypothetical protein
VPTFSLASWLTIYAALNVSLRNFFSIHFTFQPRQAGRFDRRTLNLKSRPPPIDRTRPDLGHVLINAQIGGPLSGANRKTFAKRRETGKE